MQFLNTTIPFVIAHRGISAKAPENTMPAIQAVLSSQARWFECDVMLSASTDAEQAEVYLLHDDTLDRTTSGFGMADDFPWSVLQHLDAGNWFNSQFQHTRLPLLKDVLAFLKSTNLSFNIELKSLHHREREWAECVVDTVKTSGFRMNDPRLLFSSFSVSVLQALRAQSSDAHIGFLLHDFSDEPDWCHLYRELNCVSLNINHELLTKEIVDDFLQKGMKIILAYTVDDPHRVQELFSWGVSAVFSNDPDAAVTS